MQLAVQAPLAKELSVGLRIGNILLFASYYSDFIID